MWGRTGGREGGGGIMHMCVGDTVCGDMAGMANTIRPLSLLLPSPLPSALPFLSTRLYLEARHCVRLCYVQWRDRATGQAQWQR